jgi:hypothetical protein
VVCVAQDKPRRFLIDEMVDESAVAVRGGRCVLSPVHVWFRHRSDEANHFSLGSRLAFETVTAGAGTVYRMRRTVLIAGDPRQRMAWFAICRSAGSETVPVDGRHSGVNVIPRMWDGRRLTNFTAED